MDLRQYLHPYAKATVEKRRLRMSSNDLSDWKQVACAMSHIRLWEKCAASGDPIIVVEDDQTDINLKQFVPKLIALPEDTDMAIIKCLPMNYKWESSSSFWKPVKQFVGFQCYYLTPQGANKLLKFALPVTQHIDVYASECIPSEDLKVYGHRRSNNTNVLKGSTLSHGLLNTKELYAKIAIGICIILIALFLILAVINIVRLGKCRKKVETILSSISSG